MKSPLRNSAARLFTFAFCAAVLVAPRPTRAYSVLSHEEVVDMAWKTNIVPMLKARFPGISDEEIRQAHAYAYGGSVIQDLGYYPFGSHYFSDLVHYVRPGAFVEAMIRDSTTPDEYAFGLGALAHFCGDIMGHPAINQMVADENPPLRTRFGRIITYAEDPTAHIRTEFGFDVAEVAHGHYSQENYRDFVGFQVAKNLMNQAFLETYGMPVSDVLVHEDLAISSYRKAVSTLIPKMTKVAFVSYKNQIEQASPGTTKRKFLYRLNQTEYNKQFGTDYTHVSWRGQILAFFLKFMPKVGPFRALKVTIPNAQEQTVYLKSINDAVDRYKSYLVKVHAAPAPLPAPDPQDALDAQKAANKLRSDAGKASKAAGKAQDPADKAMKAKVADHVEKAANAAQASADRTEAKVEKAAEGDGSARVRGEVAAGTPIQPPSVPKLPFVDLDTGKPSAAGEYDLADQTYARLLHTLVGEPPPGAGAAPPQAKIPPDLKPPPAAMPATDKVPSTLRPINPAVAAAIEHFFANRVPRTGQPASPREATKQKALEAQVKADLVTLKTMEANGEIALPPPSSR